MKPADPQLKRGNWRKENIKGLVMNIFREIRDFTGETGTKDYTRRKKSEADSGDGYTSLSIY